METQVFLGLGSNFGREANLSHALRSLAGELRQIRHSAVYESAALGGRGPDFLNLVVGGYTRLDPPGLVAWLKRLEAMCGRGFEAEGMVALDIDLLLYGDWVGEWQGTRVPRPNILRQSFVLQPLLELAPTLLHPQSGEPLATWWGEGRVEPPLRRVDAKLM